MHLFFTPSQLLSFHRRAHWFQFPCSVLVIHHSKRRALPCQCKQGLFCKSFVHWCFAHSQPDICLYVTFTKKKATTIFLFSISCLSLCSCLFYLIWTSQILLTLSPWTDQMLCFDLFFLAYMLILNASPKAPFLKTQFNNNIRGNRYNLWM